MLETIVQQPEVQNMLPPWGFLRSLAFGSTTVSEEDKLEIHITDEGNGIAPVDAKTSEGTSVEVAGYRSIIVNPPQINMNSTIRPVKTMEAPAGTNPYAAGNKLNRLEMALARQMARLNTKIAGRIEVQAASLLLNGTLTLRGKGVNYTDDYGRHASHTVTNGAGDGWNETTGDPLLDLEVMQDAIQAKTGLLADFVLMESQAFGFFCNHESVKKVWDFRKVDLGNIQDRRLLNMARYRGEILGMSIWTYNRAFTDPFDNSTQTMFDAGRVIVGCSSQTGARNVTNFLGIHDVRATNSQENAGDMPVAVYKTTEYQKNVGAEVLYMKSRPILSLGQPNSTFSRQVIA